MGVESMPEVAEGGRELPRSARKVERIVYRVVLPVGVVANLGLGVVILAGLEPQSWPQWLEVGTGAFCCVVAGWLAAAAWSRSYWSRTQARQVALWRQIAGTFFAWLEEASPPADSLARLKSSLDQVVPRQESR